MKLLWFSLKKCESCITENYVVVGDEVESTKSGLIEKLDLKPSEAKGLAFKGAIKSENYITVLPGGTIFLDIN